MKRTFVIVMLVVFVVSIVVLAGCAIPDTEQQEKVSLNEQLTNQQLKEIYPNDLDTALEELDEVE